MLPKGGTDFEIPARLPGVMLDAIATVIKDWSPIILPIIAAVGSVVAAGATAIIAYLAIKQLPILIKQLENAELARITAAELEKERRTIEICSRFSTDYALYCVKKSIFEQRKPEDDSGFIEPDKIKRDVKNLMNYLDSIAVGVHQGLYDEDIVFDNLNNIMIDAVDDFIFTEPRDLFCDEKNYQHLVILCNNFKIDRDRRIAQIKEHIARMSEDIAKMSEDRDRRIVTLIGNTRYSRSTARN